MGFRTGAGVLAWLAVVGILPLFTPGSTWSRLFPASRRRASTARARSSYPLVFLPFISSTFVPTRTMPGPVRAFAENQPVTSIVDTIRDLFPSSRSAPASGPPSRGASASSWSPTWCAGFAYRRRIS